MHGVFQHFAVQLSSAGCQVADGRRRAPHGSLLGIAFVAFECRAGTGSRGQVRYRRVAGEAVELGRATPTLAPHRLAEPAPGDAVQEEIGRVVDVKYLCTQYNV